MTNKNIYISARDVAEDAKLNHEITEELRRYKINHQLSCQCLTRMYVLLSILTLLPTFAHAETCTPTPDCKSLGYTETSCPDGGVKCPWNTSLLYCGENGKKICTDMGHPYPCTGTNEIPSGKACANKYYTTCTCASGYEWKNGKCEEIKNGLVGDLYYCNGAVVGIKVPGQNFAIAINDASSTMRWYSANSYCTDYLFCGTGTEGRLPTKDELLKIYNNITYLREQLPINGGRTFTSGWYWSSSAWPTSNDSYYIVNPVSGKNSGSNIFFSNTYYVRPVLDL